MSNIKKKYIIDNPALMAEWNYEKNNLLGFDPAKITYGSAIKVWWKCDKGHEWQANPNHRSRGRGCPICAESKRPKSRVINLIKKNGSLIDNNPELAAQWHPTKNGNLRPSDVTVSSFKKVWWKCDKGHEWTAHINSRHKGAGCPGCSGHKLIVGYNDLATRNPALALQWHPTKNGQLKPSDVKIHDDIKVWWVCKVGHEWLASITNRTSGDYCPYCSGKKVLVGYNDLATIMPSVAAEWHPDKNGDLKPHNVTVGSNKKVWWKCKREHEWKTEVYHRTQGRRCPKCFGEYSTSFPEQAICFYLTQITTAYSRFKIDPHTEIDVYLPEYKIGIEYDGAYFHNSVAAEKREERKRNKLKDLDIKLIRVKENASTIQEDIIKAKNGANDLELAETIKDLLKYISRITNKEFIVDVDIVRDRNKIYELYIKNEKENSLLNINPDLAKEWHPTKNGALLPEFVKAYSNKKVWWKCKIGHEWSATVNSRHRAGCPICSGYKVLIGYNDLATLKPELAKEWHPTKNKELKPSDVTLNSNKKVWWLCKEGHEWETRVFDRNRGSGCPTCYRLKRKSKETIKI